MLSALSLRANDIPGDTASKYGLGVGGQINTNGWKVLATYEHQAKPRLGHFFQLSFSEVAMGYYKKRAGSELFPTYKTSRPYIQGKINNFYSVQFGHGREITILPIHQTGQLSLCSRV